MWEKNFRAEQSMIYRKKFRCPICNQYTLLLIHDSACECSEGCETDDFNKEKINIIKKKNDFQGFFSDEEIKKNFWIDFDMVDEIFDEIVEAPKTYEIKSKDIEKINNLFKRTGIIDKKLDDTVTKYFNCYELDENSEYKPYSYLITLVEDMHYFMNLSCKDLYLLDMSLSEELPHNEIMYSGRFFGNNAIDHLFQANERMYVILGLIFGYKFDDNLNKNKTFNIVKFLKKNNGYISNYKSLIEKLCSNKFYSNLKEIRNSNEHDLSFATTKVASGEIIDYDNADKLIYLPLVKELIYCLDIMYEVLEKMVIQLNDVVLYELDEFPMYNQFVNEEIKLPQKQYDMKYYNILQKLNADLADHVDGFCGNMIITDVYFRLDEVLHCIRDIYSYNSNCNKISGVDFGDFIDIEYVIYSAITRLYSCYDKIARYISNISNEYSKTNYFEDMRKVESASTLSKKLSKVLDNQYYCWLQRIRNMIYHNLRAGIVFGKKAEQYYRNILIELILENELLLFQLLDEIMPIKNKKIERNAPCPCGSKKKFKYCHGRKI